MDGMNIHWSLMRTDLCIKLDIYLEEIVQENNLESVQILKRKLSMQVLEEHALLFSWRIIQSGIKVKHSIINSQEIFQNQVLLN